MPAHSNAELHPDSHPAPHSELHSDLHAVLHPAVHRVLRHVVLFAFKEDAPAEAVDAVVSGFGKLPGTIPGIVGYETGTNVSPEGLNDSYTHCFTLTFISAEARDDYLNHPAHVRFVKTLATCLERSLVIDYWAQQRPGPEEDQARILAGVP